MEFILLALIFKNDNILIFLTKLITHTFINTVKFTSTAVMAFDSLENKSKSLEGTSRSLHFVSVS